MTKKISTDVFINMQVQVKVSSTWSADTTLAQIQRQATVEAERAVKKALTNKAVIVGGGVMKILSTTE